MRSEEEQAEALRAWWEKNGVTVILAVVLAVVSLLGWRQWTTIQTTRASDASVLYQTMVAAVERMEERPGSDGASRVAAVNEAADKVVSEYPRSSYADFARLMQARLAAQAGDLDKTAALLADVAGRTRDRELEATTRLRLARVHLARDAHAEALAELNRAHPAAWQGRVEEVRGDVLRAQQQLAPARQAYTKAIDLMKDDETGRDRVQMKLDDLAPSS